MDTLGQGIVYFIDGLFSLQRLKCTGIIEKRTQTQSVSFIERFFGLLYL